MSFPRLHPLGGPVRHINSAASKRAAGHQHHAHDAGVPAVTPSGRPTLLHLDGGRDVSPPRVSAAPSSDADGYDHDRDLRAEQPTPDWAA